MAGANGKGKSTLEANLPEEIIHDLLQNYLLKLQQDSKQPPHSLRYEIRNFKYIYLNFVLNSINLCNPITATIMF
ncbi:MAG: hypothetical protein AAF757_21280 [Cyanobacteria bacterium P01_D01_bin.116]